MPERWLPAVGREGKYEVSDQGRVQSLDRIIVQDNGVIRSHRGRVLKPTKNSKGYAVVSLCRKQVLVHLLVLRTFVGECPVGLEGCHWNGDGMDPRLENLRWDTRSANALDRLRHGTYRSPSWAHAAKTHCPAKHEYTEENTYMYRGRRQCKECGRRRVRESRAKKAVA